MQKAYNDGEEWTSRLGLLESGSGCGEKRKETFENEDRNFIRKFELKMDNLSKEESLLLQVKYIIITCHQ